VFVSARRTRIAELHFEGHSTSAIASELGLARNTVTYHLTRLGPAADNASLPPPAPNAVSQVRTRQRVRELLDAGWPRASVARQLGLSKSTVSYHARRLDKPIDVRCARRYDWTVVQAFYDAGASVRETAMAFGFSMKSWHCAANRGDIVARPAAMPLSKLLVADTYRGREHLKRRILDAGLKRPECERCGISHWHGRRIGLALHHSNGDRIDNRLENLQLLCPNCHSQPTISPDAIARRRWSRRALLSAPHARLRTARERGLHAAHVGGTEAHRPPRSGLDEDAREALRHERGGRVGRIDDADRVVAQRSEAAARPYEGGRVDDRDAAQGYFS